MSAPPRVVGVLIVLGLGLLIAGSAAIVLIGGCEKADAPTQTPDLPPPDQTYTVRGRIARLPTPDSPDVHIAHEAIPGFVGMDGEVVGMGAMTMPFTPAPGLDIAGLEVGDDVEFTFEVRWSGGPPALVTQIEKK